MTTTDNKSNIFKLERGSVGNVACQICGKIHIPANKCANQDLVHRIHKLLEANAIIPSILAANKEAVDLAAYFQDLNAKADYGFTLIQEVCAAHGETGEKIKLEFMERLDKWVAEFTNRDTSQQTQNTDQLTLSETNASECTPTPDGPSSQLILSP